jgi:hypothetical protein
MTEDDQLPSEERAALERLPRDIAPAPDLEDRVVGHLRHQGAFARRSTLRPALAVAASVIVAFGLGVGAGRAWQPDGSDRAAGQRYLLLLYGGDTATPEEESKRVAEYGEWARVEAAAGRMEGGEKLDGNSSTLGNPIVSGPAPSGFFIIRAASEQEAQSIAMRCPHLRHSGTVLLRPIASSGG